MTVTITSDSPYVVSSQATAGTSDPITFYVAPTPQITISGVGVTPAHA